VFLKTLPGRQGVHVLVSKRPPESEAPPERATPRDRLPSASDFRSTAAPSVEGSRENKTETKARVKRLFLGM
jgi:hypothetical protein